VESRASDDRLRYESLEWLARVESLLLNARSLGDEQRTEAVRKLDESGQALRRRLLASNDPAVDEVRRKFLKATERLWTLRTLPPATNQLVVAEAPIQKVEPTTAEPPTSSMASHEVEFVARVPNPRLRLVVSLTIGAFLLTVAVQVALFYFVIAPGTSPRGSFPLVLWAPLFAMYAPIFASSIGMVVPLLRRQNRRHTVRLRGRKLTTKQDINGELVSLSWGLPPQAPAKLCLFIPPPAMTDADGNRLARDTMLGEISFALTSRKKISFETLGTTEELEHLVAQINEHLDQQEAL